tara:strand:- start:7826 stop:8167 length:342 start_codon:yes stop_codon:yes gene_type:complete
LSPLAVFAAMLAHQFDSFAGLQIFSFWKKRTQGKYLWLRNNLSTFSSQFIHTFTIVFLMCSFNISPWSIFESLLVSGFLFKVLVAALETPILNGIVFLFRRRFHLKIGSKILD